MSGIEPKCCIIYQRHDVEVALLKSGRDITWEQALDNNKLHSCVPVESNEPMYILYTSGTTGMSVIRASMNFHQ